MPARAYIDLLGFEPLQPNAAGYQNAFSEPVELSRTPTGGQLPSAKSENYRRLEAKGVDDAGLAQCAVTVSAVAELNTRVNQAIATQEIQACQQNHVRSLKRCDHEELVGTCTDHHAIGSNCRNRLTNSAATAYAGPHARGVGQL
jgi:hypothetical protein